MIINKKKIFHANFKQLYKDICISTENLFQFLSITFIFSVDILMKALIVILMNWLVIGWLAA